MFEFLSGFMLHPTMAIGTAAVASPILIHILSKRRYQRVRWAAMSFLLDALHRNRRRVRLEQLLLLLLRCLAVLLIALMMTRPFLRSGALSAILGMGPRSERIVLLDDSYSMGYRLASGASGGSVFARGKQAATQLAEWIARETPADSLTLYLTSAPHEPAIALPSLSDENLQRLREHVDGLKPSQTVARPSAAIVSVADAIQNLPGQANALVYVISDFQREDWIRRPAAAVDETAPSAVAPLAELREQGLSVRLVLVNVGEAAAGNVAITALQASQPQIVSGVPARFQVAVSNHSSVPLKQVGLSVSIAQHRLPPVVIPKIDAGQTVHEPIEVTFPQDGPDKIQVTLAGAVVHEDGVRLDNTRAMGVDVVPSVQVLMVDGESSNDPYRDEVYLLRTSLRPAGRAASGNELSVVDEQELDDVELDPYHVVIMANVGRLSQTARRKVEAFVADGGGLVIFAGDQIDLDQYNAELYRNGDGVLPLALVDVAEPPPGARMMTFARWDSSHPMMRSFVDELAGVLRQVQINAYIKLQTPIDDGADVTTGKSQDEGEDRVAGAKRADEQPGRAPARVLARFNDSNESPAIVERSFGRGTCIFIATSADQEWNDWASNFSYLPLMMELVQYAARPSQRSAQAVVGAPIECPLDTAIYKRRAELRTPGYPVEPTVFLDAEPRDDSPDAEQAASGLVLRFRGTQKVGVYRFLLATTTGESVSRYVAVNPEPQESDLRGASRDELDRALGEAMPFEYVADVSALAGSSADARPELWWPLLLGAMVVLMSEHVLAWWFGMRG